MHQKYVSEQDYKTMYTPVQSSFTVGKWGIRGSHFFQGYVILMNIRVPREARHSLFRSGKTQVEQALKPVIYLRCLHV